VRAPGIGGAQRRFLIMSAAAGIAEIGILLIAIQAGATLREVLLLALIYQLAGFLVALRVPKTAVSLFALMAAAAVAWWTASSRLLLVVVAVLMSVGVHGAREASRRAGVSTAAKRTARIGGFLIAGLAAPLLIVASAIVSAVALRHGRPQGITDRQRLDWRLGRLSVAMVVHQAHYFCYTYVLIWLLAGTHAFRPALASAIFAAGWITYTASPWLLGRIEAGRAFVVGHVTNAILLGALALLWEHPWLLALLWVATGVGGGTVTALRRLGVGAGISDSMFDRWEGVGHVVGVLLALAVSFAGVSAVFVVAAGLALSAAALVAAALMAPRPQREQSVAVVSR
jgi:hypothetical protein